MVVELPTKNSPIDASCRSRATSYSTPMKCRCLSCSGPYIGSECTASSTSTASLVSSNATLNGSNKLDLECFEANSFQNFPTCLQHERHLPLGEILWKWCLSLSILGCASSLLCSFCTRRLRFLKQFAGPSEKEENLPTSKDFLLICLPCTAPNTCSSSV
jgi:hypothetical protein